MTSRARMAAFGVPLVMIGAFFLLSSRREPEPAALLPDVSAPLSAAPLPTPIIGALSSARPAAPASQALNEAKQTSVALILYTGDSDDVLPPAEGWRGRIARFDKSSKVYPLAFNAPLSGAKLVQLNSPERTVVLFSAKRDEVVGGPEEVPTPFPFRDGTQFVTAFADGNARFSTGLDVFRVAP